MEWLVRERTHPNFVCQKHILASCLRVSERFPCSCIHTSDYQPAPSITSGIREKNTCTYHISTFVWRWEMYSETARISLYQSGDEDPQAVFSDGMGQSFWLTIQQYVSHGLKKHNDGSWSAAGWRNDPQARSCTYAISQELCTSGAGKQASTLLPQAASPPSLCSHLSVRVWWLRRKPRQVLNLNSNWVQSENCCAKAVMTGEKLRVQRTLEDG